MLVFSILLVISLSLFKEGVFFSGNHKVSRCSILGLTVIIVISLYCLCVSLVCYRFVIKHERKILLVKFLKIDFEEEKMKGEHPENEEYEDPSQDDSVTNFDLQLKLSLKNEHDFKKAFRFKRNQLIKLCVVSLFVGTGAGLLGIGGGMVLIPILIAMDFTPLDASAVTSMGVLITSTISTSEFLIMKAIKFSDLSYFLFFAAIGSIIGVFIIKELIIAFKRQSMLLVVILGIFVVAIIVLPLFGFLVIPVKDYFQPGTLCI